MWRGWRRWNRPGVRGTGLGSPLRRADGRRHERARDSMTGVDRAGTVRIRDDRFVRDYILEAGERRTFFREVFLRGFRSLRVAMAFLVSATLSTAQAFPPGAPVVTYA